jgi:isopentenyl diphosphate isomerase/L-lactate dehydrogenase-like FMN-dependent dehydrogenase
MFNEVAEYEAQALKNLPRYARDYYRSGANAEVTLTSSADAFNELKLKQSAESVNEEIDTRMSFFGKQISSPICAAATAFHRMAHPQGELMSAAAAEAHN